MNITSDQIRAARALKNWSQAHLAALCAVTTATIANIELGKQNPSVKTLNTIQTVFEAANIGFTPHEGVYKKHLQVQSFSGLDGFTDFLQYVDTIARSHPGDEFLVAHVNERDFIHWQGGAPSPTHEQAIRDNNIRYRILICDGDDYMPAAHYATYAQVSQRMFRSVPFYIFGDHVALLSLTADEASIFLISHAPLVALYRQQFEEMWEHSKLI